VRKVNDNEVHKSESHVATMTL